MALVVPRQGIAEPILHADVEVEHHEDGCLQAVGQVEGQCGELECLLWIFGEKQNVLGITVRRVRARHNVGLLRACRHACGRAAALNVEDYRRNLGEIPESDEFLHQRDARSGCARECARAVPCRAHHDAYRRELVLGLDDSVARLAGRGIGAVPLAMAREGFGQRRRRRDGIPGGDGRPPVYRAQRRGAVALDENLLTDRIRTLDADAQRPVELVLCIRAAHLHRLHVGLEQRLLALVELADQLGDRLGPRARRYK